MGCGREFMGVTGKLVKQSDSLWLVRVPLPTPCILELSAQLSAEVFYHHVEMMTKDWWGVLFIMKWVC